MEELLGGFSRERLKEKCRQLDLDDSGKEKAVIIDRCRTGRSREPADEQDAAVEHLLGNGGGVSEVPGPPPGSPNRDKGLESGMNCVGPCWASGTELHAVAERTRLLGLAALVGHYCFVQVATSVCVPFLSRYPVAVHSHESTPLEYVSPLSPVLGGAPEPVIFRPL